MYYVLYYHVTWSNNCFPVVFGWMANSSSASMVVTRTFTGFGIFHYDYVTVRIIIMSLLFWKIFVLNNGSFWVLIILLEQINAVQVIGKIRFLIINQRNRLDALLHNMLWKIKFIKIESYGLYCRVARLLIVPPDVQCKSTSTFDHFKVFFTQTQDTISSPTTGSFNE